MAASAGPNVVEDGLVLALDSANTKSHSGQFTYNWYDLINNIHFTGYNSPQWNTTFNSTSYNGSNEYYQNSSGWTSFGTDTFSIEVWFRVHATGVAEALVSNVGTGNGTFQVAQDSSGFLVFGGTTTSGTGEVITATSALPLNIWQQCVMVREGTGTNQFKLYLDGSLNTTGTLTANLNSTAQLRIGRNRNGNHYFDGDIATIRIYKNKALTAAEVEQHYNATKGRYGY